MAAGFDLVAAGMALKRVELFGVFAAALPVGDADEDGWAGAGGCVWGAVLGAGFGVCGVAMGVCGVPDESLGSDEAGC